MKSIEQENKTLKENKRINDKNIEELEEEVKEKGDRIKELEEKNATQS